MRGDPDRVQPYGMQREICARARPDSRDGSPRQAPLRPVGGVYRLSGPVRVSPLREAVHLVVDGMDILHGRLRRIDGRFWYVPGIGVGRVPVSTVDLSGVPSDRHRSLLPQVLSLAQLGDLQDGPLGFATIVRLAPEQHLLSLWFDHSVADHITLTRAIRRIGDVYQRLCSGDEDAAVRAAASDSFQGYVRAREANGADRPWATDFWRAAAETPAVPCAFPGTHWRPWRERLADRNVVRQLTADEWMLLRRASRAAGATLTTLLIAAVSLVAAGGMSCDFVPVTYAYHGRDDAAKEVPGPLWENRVSRRPDGDPDGGLRAWVAAFAATNDAAPPMRDWALVDFVGLDATMELRRFTVNVRVPQRAIAFGAGRAEPLEFLDLPSPAATHPAPMPHNTGIRLILRSTGTPVLALHHDQDDLPDGGFFLGAMLRVAALVAYQSTVTVRQTMEGIRRSYLSRSAVG